MVKREKKTYFSEIELSLFDNETYNLYALTERQAQLALVALNVSQWFTRWLDVTTNKETVLSFASETSEALMTPLDFCQYVADCIQNNQSVKDALNGYLKDNYQPTNNPNGVIGSGEENVLSGVICDNDYLYGACVSIVDYVHAVALDALEAVDNAPNFIEDTLRMLDFFPLLGDLPVIDDLSDIVEWFDGNGVASFNAGYTVQMRQDLICALFELACSGCELTVYDITAVFATQGGYSINPNMVWIDLVKTFLFSTNDTMFTTGVLSMCAGVLAVGGSIGGMTGYQSLTTIARSADPDNDWSIFCDPCTPAAEWCYLLDFAISDYSQHINSLPSLNNDGSQLCGVKIVDYVSGQYWRVTSNSLIINVPSQTIFTRLIVSVEVDGGTAGSLQIVICSTDPTVAPNTSTFVFNNNTAGNHTYDIPIPEAIGAWVLVSRCTVSGNTRVKSIQIEGIGNNPFGSDNC